MTNTTFYDWNNILPHIRIGTQIMTGTFVITTTMIIKIFFKMTKVPNQKLKISFKKLNTIYSLGLNAAAVVVGFSMIPKIPILLHFTTTSPIICLSIA